MICIVLFQIDNVEMTTKEDDNELKLIYKKEIRELKKLVRVNGSCLV